MPMNGVLWVTNHTGKMTGISSINTSCADNPHCIERRENGLSVCSKCYAATYLKMRKSLKEHLVENANVLTTGWLKYREVPVINDKVFRFESFGDLYNNQHLMNYMIICNANPFTKFALYTKNVWILEDVFLHKRLKKPHNLSIVVSSPLLNKQMWIDRDEFWFIDHVFTVYDKKFIAENDVNINCGARSCMDCLCCYKTNTTFYVNEKLK